MSCHFSELFLVYLHEEYFHVCHVHGLETLHDFVDSHLFITTGCCILGWVFWASLVLDLVYCHSIT